VSHPEGRNRILGTNPLGFGIPTAKHPPFILDFATTNVAGAKLLMAAAEGVLATEGSIRDRDGRPTVDPLDYTQRGGSMAPLGYPFAGHKGFGLALVVDALGGILTRSGFAKNVVMGGNPPGNFFWALDVEAFLPLAEFQGRMDELLDMVKEGEPIEGIGELYFPGERGQRRADEITARGEVPLIPVSWNGLVMACEAVNVPLPPVIAS
jgi:LDH2 family malate/lactate/ureidoglycolate dehydrogenase